LESGPERKRPHLCLSFSGSGSGTPIANLFFFHDRGWIFVVKKNCSRETQK
jgi:hypothetical protein